eukprot:TRINITY_DN6874_c0_g1_i1.p2 TRINITY_DN6874_c0_g1~~TRINITY_DN6874_c0_g1_i1.p2  ORF type:complete len:106 (-),score=19.69 TRINITY_DN6874_c0_g1_i1:986-1303(-)
MRTHSSTSLYKKGDSGDIGNYRPINMSNCLYKIFVNKVIFSLNHKVDSDQRILTYIDLKGAYDNVSHNILFQIMKKYGFNEDFIEMMKNIFNGSNTRIQTPFNEE